MKLLILCLSLLVATPTLYAQSWAWSDIPQAGAKADIRIKDVSEPTDQLSLLLYYIDGGKLYAQDVDLRPGMMDENLRATVTVPSKASWIALALKNEDGDILSTKTDVVQNNMAMPQASSVEEGMALAGYAGLIGMDKDDKQALALLRDAVIADTKWLDQPNMMMAYFRMANAVESAKDLELIKNHASAIVKNAKNYPEDILVQSIQVVHVMGDTLLKATLRKNLNRRYPNNILQQEDMLASFKKAESMEDKLKIWNQFKSKYPLTDDNRNYMSQMASTLVQYYAEKDDWTNAKKYIHEIPSPTAKANTCNSYAWKLSGESVDKEGSHYDVAAELSALSMESLASQIGKPTYYSEKTWAKNMTYSRSQYADTYALVLYKQGKINEAIEQQAFAVQFTKFQEPELNERYAIYLEKAGRNKELAEFMDQIMVSGKASPKVKELHRAYWTKTASPEALYDQYLTQIETRAHDLLVDKVLKMWKEDESMAFSLKDLQGNDVALEDYKGKTVILDFWATWCGPCKASFPGMKRVVENYASDKNVVFLFIDTWENPDNRDTRVADFIRTNNYPFHVLIDGDNAVVGSYKVQGIPTKFIIGPDQKVRFVSVGYSGNPDELVEEMKIMIELAREKSVARS